MKRIGIALSMAVVLAGAVPAQNYHDESYICGGYGSLCSTTMVAGIHQEGPYISPHDGPRGAHPLEHVTRPDLETWERFQEASGRRISMLTLAPEVPGMLDFIRHISGQGVVVCLGHHQADGATIRRAIEAGARSVTHLGNGCQPLMPRHPNILWQQAAQDRLYASVIADGSEGQPWQHCNKLLAAHGA